MRDKFFERLPKALHREIDTHLNSSESTRLASTSTYFKSISELPPISFETRKSLKKFLNHVVHGEHQQVQEMLRNDIRLLVQRDTVTDCSGRRFTSISGFEYALWALDKHLWDDMLACLPRDENNQLMKESQKMVNQLQHQYTHVKTNGVSYQLNGMSEKESHYDFAIIDALREQVDAQNAPGVDRNAIDEHWRTLVGGIQRLYPMHVVDEYCSDTPFTPVPKFDSRPKPARGLRQFYNWVPSLWESWFDNHSNLGFDFAIAKALARAGAARASWACPAVEDLTAMSALYETRTLDFSVLEAQLESMMVDEKCPRPGI